MVGFLARLAALQLCFIVLASVAMLLFSRSGNTSVSGQAEALRDAETQLREREVELRAIRGKYEALQKENLAKPALTQAQPCVGAPGAPVTVKHESAPNEAATRSAEKHRPPIFATYVTDRGPGAAHEQRLCRAMESVVRAGYEYHLLAFGDRWRGVGDKILGQELFVRGLHADQLVIFADGHDVIANANSSLSSPARALEMYERHYEGKMVVGAEKNCHPHNDKAFCFSLYPKNDRYPSYRWLNSGFWISRAGVAQKILADLIQNHPVMLHKHFSWAPKSDDQGRFAERFVAGDQPLVLDDGLAFVLNLFSAEFDFQWNTRANMWFANVSNTYPLFLHGNGLGKEKMVSFESALWYHKLDGGFWGDSSLAERTITVARNPSDFFQERKKPYVLRKETMDTICLAYKTWRRGESAQKQL